MERMNCLCISPICSPSKGELFAGNMKKHVAAKYFYKIKKRKHRKRKKERKKEIKMEEVGYFAASVVREVEEGVTF